MVTVARGRMGEPAAFGIPALARALNCARVGDRLRKRKPPENGTVAEPDLPPTGSRWPELRPRAVTRLSGMAPEPIAPTARAKTMDGSRLAQSAAGRAYTLPVRAIRKDCWRQTRLCNAGALPDQSQDFICYGHCRKPIFRMDRGQQRDQCYNAQTKAGEPDEPRHRYAPHKAT